MYQGLSPAQRHKSKVAAEKEATKAIENPTRTRNVYELMLGKLATDKRRLKKIQSIEQKINVKREELLPEYEAYLDGVLEADTGVEDQVLTTLLVWHIDAGNYARAIQLAGYALEHKLPMPSHFDRSLESTLTEEIADDVIRKGNETENIDILYQVFSLVHEKDMADQIKAKLMKALGNAERDNDPRKAIEFYQRAVGLHDRIGVKKDIAALEKKIEEVSDDSSNVAINTGN